MSRIRLLLACISALWLAGCVTVTPQVKKEPPAPTPVGEHANLDQARVQRQIERLQSGDNTTLEQILNDPSIYPPPVLYALADTLYQQGEVAPAMFWFYTAQLRARSDANKSLDPTTADGVTTLAAQYSKEIPRYAIAHLDEFQPVMAHVLQWDKISHRMYDPRWVALLGKAAFTNPHIEFQPASKWPAIDLQTREGFQRGYENMLRQLGGQP